jgi:hypothetical protein
MATLYLAAQAFGAPTAGVCTANTIGDDLSIDADGTPTWFRVLRADGISPLWDGTVGTSGCDLNFDSVSWTAGYTAIVSSFTFTASKG